MHTSSKEAQNNDRGFVYAFIQPSYIRPYICFFVVSYKKKRPVDDPTRFHSFNTWHATCFIQMQVGNVLPLYLAILWPSPALPCRPPNPTHHFFFFVLLHGSRRPFRKRKRHSCRPSQSTTRETRKRDKIEGIRDDLIPLP